MSNTIDLTTIHWETWVGFRTMKTFTLQVKEMPKSPSPYYVELKGAGGGHTLWITFPVIPDSKMSVHQEWEKTSSYANYKLRHYPLDAVPVKAPFRLPELIEIWDEFIDLLSAPPPIERMHEVYEYNR